MSACLENDHLKGVVITSNASLKKIKINAVLEGLTVCQSLKDLTSSTNNFYCSARTSEGKSGKNIGIHIGMVSLSDRSWVGGWNLREAK